MKARTNETLIQEIESFSPKVSQDAKFTISTIRNLIESNSRVEESIDALHLSINNSSKQNEKLQTRIYALTIVAVILTLVQALAVLVQLINK
ncbi:MAG: hypothetical protein A2776_00665 [Candidatus Levybacteria bacterium RIFCSPHIGHO2_01_FULL_40_10]|nr:MAG: hypothetical protein A2776_00665 [Candidatus Levybacteria bacterium RIFCSPHIGHO2_01_FULL_40_10]